MIFRTFYQTNNLEVPFYEFLKNERVGVAGTPQIKWNFTKFLANKNGEVIERFSPQVESNEIEASIKKYL